MKIPKSLKVGGHTYSVTYSKGNDEKKGKDSWGLTNHEHKNIYIDKDVPESQREETFIHEILHCVTHHTKINYEMDDDKEENLVKRIACGLYMVLKDNNLLR